MAVLLDIAVVGIAALFIFLSAKAGVAKGLVGFCAFVLACVLSAMLTPTVTELVYDGFIKGGLEAKIADTLAESSGSSAETNFESVLDVIPSGCVEAAEALGIDIESLIPTHDIFSYDADTAANDIAENMAKPIVSAALSGVVSFAIFIVLSIALALLSPLLLKITDVPVIGFFDKLLGAVCGAGQALVLLFILLFVLKLYLDYNGGAWGALDETVIEQTFIAKYLYFNNPFIHFLGYVVK